MHIIIVNLVLWPEFIGDCQACFHINWIFLTVLFAWNLDVDHVYFFFPSEGQKNFQTRTYIGQSYQKDEPTNEDCRQGGLAWFHTRMFSQLNY